MDIRKLCHIWAAQSRESGKWGNVFFNGPRIYSYGSHFDIASFTDKTDTNGERIVLFTSRSYSVSTARHISYTRDALHGLPVRLIYCHNPGARYNFEHSANAEKMLGEYNAVIKSASTARSRASEYLANAESIRANCADYCRAFDCKMPADMLVEISPELLARTGMEERARKSELNVRHKAMNAIYKLDREQRGHADMLAFRAGIGPAGLNHYTGDTMLRLSADGTEIETSRGVSVPIDAALKLWRMVEQCQRKERELQTPPPVRVGDFALRHILANGDVQVGCHSIPFAESNGAGSVARLEHES